MDAEEKLIEERKLQIEERKLELEARKAKWTTASILASVLVAGVTISVTAWSTQSTAKYQLQTETAKLMFTGDDAGAAVGKGRAMVELLGSSLPQDIQDKLKSNTWVTLYLQHYPARDPNYEQKVELLKVLASNSTRQQQILENWCLMFQDDAWVEESFGTANVPAVCRKKH